MNGKRQISGILEEESGAGETGQNAQEESCEYEILVEEVRDTEFAKVAEEDEEDSEMWQHSGLEKILVGVGNDSTFEEFSSVPDERNQVSTHHLY